MNQPGEAPRCVKCGSHRDANVHIHPNMFGYHKYKDAPSPAHTCVRNGKAGYPCELCTRDEGVS